MCLHDFASTKGVQQRAESATRSELNLNDSMQIPATHNILSMIVLVLWGPCCSAHDEACCLLLQGLIAMTTDLP